jgi:Zn-dependent protease
VIPAGVALTLLYGSGRAMFKDGHFRLGQVGGTELRLHWSLPVGAVVFGSLRFEPILWLAFLTVIVVHELGHVALVSALGFELSGVDLTGFGGHCRFRGNADALDHALIAWGGLVAQGLLLLGTLLVGAVFGRATSHAGVLVEQAFIAINLWIIGLNLLPFAPLDGARAWRLFPELTARGWSMSRLVFYPLWRWADRRRRRRGVVPLTGAAASGAAEPVAEPRRHARSVPTVADAAERDAADADDDIGEKPSAQAQRELAALLDRIGDEAGRAKKRR